MTTLHDSDENLTKEDYNYSRDTYYDLIDKSLTAIDELTEIAKQSEHARDFEVLAKIIKNTADINDKIMDLNKKNKDIKNNAPEDQIEGSTNNNILITSTTDIQKMLKEAKEKHESDIVDITPDE